MTAIVSGFEYGNKDSVSDQYANFGGQGQYNRVVKVNSSSTVVCTGSYFGPSAFIIENKTNVTLTPVTGNALATTGLIVGEIYPIGLRQVTIGATGVVYLLYKT